MSTVLYLFFMVSDSYLKHIKSVPSPYKGTSEWRMYGAGTDLIRFGYGVDSEEVVKPIMALWGYLLLFNPARILLNDCGVMYRYDARCFNGTYCNNSGFSSIKVR